MKHQHTSITTVKTLGAILTMALGLLACAALPAQVADTWKEEVLLHDGQKIIVERSQTYGGRSEPGQSGPIGEHSIRFTVPGASRTMTWTSEYGEDIGRTNFNLLAVHVKDGTPYIVAEPNLCLSYNKWGRPNPPYVFFKLDGDTWQRIPLDQFPAEFQTINVALSIRGAELKSMLRMNVVPSDTIKQMNAHREQPEYKSILRGPLNYDPSCIPMVTNGKGLWLSKGWFSSKPTLEACLVGCKRESFDEKTCPCNKVFEGK